MRVVLVVLSFTAVMFLLRVLVALALEWARWPSGGEETTLARYNPSRNRENLLVTESRIPWMPESPAAGAIGRVSLRA